MVTNVCGRWQVVVVVELMSELELVWKVLLLVAVVELHVMNDSRGVMRW